MKFLGSSDEASSKASGPIAICSRTFLDSIIKLLQRHSGHVGLVVQSSRLCTNCHFWTPSYLDLTYELHLPLQILTALALAVHTWRCVPQKMTNVIAALSRGNLENVVCSNRILSAALAHFVNIHRKSQFWEHADINARRRVKHTCETYVSLDVKHSSNLCET